jgi:hypothetical protein
MRNLLALIGLVVVAFAVIGWHQGWYQLDVTKSTDGNLRVETNVNTRKVVDDTGAAIKQGSDLVGNRLEKASQNAQPTPGTTPGPQDQKISLFGIDLSAAQK